MAALRRTAWHTPKMHVMLVLLLLVVVMQRACALSWRDKAHMRTRGQIEEREPDAARGPHNAHVVMPFVDDEYDDINTMTFEILQVACTQSSAFEIVGLCALIPFFFCAACAWAHQYNVFGRPYEVSKDGQAERLARIPASLRKLSEHIDVVTFAEADVKNERESMLAQFRDSGFQYATSILHDPDPFTRFEELLAVLLNGGVMVVSRWPILHEAQHIYRSACHYSDCLAAKGVKYARVLKTVGITSKIFNVFATHMQAWSTPQGRSDRVEQAKQMRKFVDDMRIPAHEPLLFAGDFNVDNHTFASEVAGLIELLGAQSPTQMGEQQFTSDPRSNLLVGRDGAANSNKCSEKYMQSWGDDKDGVYYPNALTRSTCDLHQHLPHELLVFIQLDNMCFCSCCPLEWLDYVLYAKAPYQQPLAGSTLESRINHVDPFVVDWTAPKSNMKMQLVDLSDHYPVLGKFVFAVNRGPGKDDDPLTYHLDGCSTDADCHFRALRCYCNGANCYYNGTHLDGWDLASTHPVNRNCLYQKTSFQCLCGPT